MIVHSYQDRKEIKVIKVSVADLDLSDPKDRQEYLQRCLVLLVRAALKGSKDLEDREVYKEKESKGTRGIRVIPDPKVKEGREDFRETKESLVRLALYLALSGCEVTLEYLALLLGRLKKYSNV